MEYFIKFSAVLSLFYIFYKLFLENETFFNSIRVYFILGVISALVTPLILIPEYVYIEDLFAGQTITTSVAETASSESGQFDLMTILLTLYGAGIIFFAIRFLMQLASLSRFIIRLPKKKIGRFIFISTEESISPFSFFNYIIYPNNGFDENELDQIIAHEKVHATQFHTLDILLSQLLIIFNWFNPLAWLYHREIQKNLEFIADQGAQRDLKAKESYQYLLLKTVTPNYSLPLTSNFYNSIIKKRINMLHKNKSGKMMYAKFIFIIPILVAFVMTFNTKVIAQEKKTEKHEIHNKVEIEMITKDFQKSDLEALKANLLKKGINLNYKKLKYNDNNEITGIQVNVSNKQNNKARISQSGTSPIKPISIKFDDKGALALGNMKGMEGHHVFFSTDSDSDGNKIFIRKSGEGSENHNENFVWVSKEGEQTEVKVTNGKKVVIKTKGDNDWEEKVWVSESGDTTKVKKIKIIEIDEENDGENQVMIKKVHKDGEEVEVTVKKIGKSDKGAKKMMFISEDGEQPLMIVDGKEMEGGSLEDIDPESIETVNVYKGDKAIEEYGEKAKNGVVVIKTKK
ncbi:M56 family metallopeptidase [Lutimonas vermicola]|uniref:M56 family metallopeptidase n=1 Tax=Lutimonas vermicola TaxID=414288 RepID=A0ABU9L4H7_9FLAO